MARIEWKKYGERSPYWLASIGIFTLVASPDRWCIRVDGADIYDGFRVATPAANKRKAVAALKRIVKASKECGL